MSGNVEALAVHRRRGPQPARRHPGGDLRAGVDPELVEDVLHVRLHGALCNGKMSGNFSTRLVFPSATSTATSRSRGARSPVRLPVPDLAGASDLGPLGGAAASAYSNASARVIMRPSACAAANVDVPKASRAAAKRSAPSTIYADQ